MTAQEDPVRRQILIAEPFDFNPMALDLLRERADVSLRALTSDDLRDALDAYDVVWIRLGHRIDAALVSDVGRCRIIATPVTGLDHIDLEACARAGIQVVSLRGETEFLRGVRATAELTIGLAITLMRRVVPAARHVISGGWDRDQFRGHELNGKVAGVIGLGRLGTIVSDYFRAFGVEVIAFDPFVTNTGPTTVVNDLEELMGRADVVTVHARYDEATHHLIGAEALAAMRPTAVLINTARGGLVDTEALLAALSEGRLAGAALDVVDGEPSIGVDHPLVRYARENDNLLIVPHIGGNTVESVEKTERFLAERVLEALEQDRPTGSMV